jgi:hypothetical protein
MKASHFLRAASIITLLYAAGHTAGAPWTPYTDPQASAVLEAMKAHSFDAQGFKGSYWDLYIGFGTIITIYLLVQAAALWQLASLAKTNAASLRPIIATFLLGFIINAALSWKYFFVIPVLMAAAISLCLAIALALSAPAQPADRPVPSGA